MIERPLVELALVDLLDTFASNDPVPVGGSASALAGALGVSLLIMVADMTRTRTGAEPGSGGAPLRLARRRPWRSLRSSRRAQNQYSSPAQVLANPLPITRFGRNGHGERPAVLRHRSIEGL